MDKPKTPSKGEKNTIPRSITTEMKESYLDYAMSVITARALPDVRDGLKPVHRRILFSCHERGLTFAARFRKSAFLVGDVLGNYHPHGDAAVYDALVKMAQDFSLRYPLIAGQGNFGNVDGDPPAAMRYTEVKMSRIASEMLRDIEKETVEWRQNFEGTRREPTVLPAAIPNLVFNGTLGIAVGMASNIPPHNLAEVIDATIDLIDHPEATTEELLKFIKGPDFPTGGVLYGEKDMLHAYASGRGSVVVRGEAEIMETSGGTFQIVVTSIPYRVNKADLIIKIADLVREKKLEGVKALRDESAKDMRIVVELKQGSFPQNILNFLYKHTQLEDPFHFNMVALVGGVPQTLSLKSFLVEFIRHRETIVRRRSEFDLKRAEEREHILRGFKTALDHIDEIIKLIKGAQDVEEAHAALRRRFQFSDVQASAILEMKLQKLAALERRKVEDELRSIERRIAELQDLLKHPHKILAVIKTELKEVKEKYVDERRTKIVKRPARDFSPEDIIPDVESVLTLTAGGYIKRSDPREYRKQRRGGVGVIDLDTKEEDFVTNFLTATNHSDLLFFTDRGKAYKIKMYEIPEGRRATRGKSIMNFLALAPTEKVTSILPAPKQLKGVNLSLLMVTKLGIGKKVDASSFEDFRRSGLIAIKLRGDDELISVRFVKRTESVIVVTALGQSVRFRESDIRLMGRSAAGVRVAKLRKGDHLVAADILPNEVKNASFLIITENGYGKKTLIRSYRMQKRGGSGIKTAKLTRKTGALISGKVVTEEQEVVAISKKSQVIRVDLAEIPVLGRQTQGVRIMKLRAGDSIASLICL